MKILWWHASLIRKIFLFVVAIVALNWETVYGKEDIWSQAFVRFTGLMGKSSDLKGLNLSTVVIHGNQVYARQEWEKQEGWQLQGTVGEEIKIGCRMINRTTHGKATQISVSTTPTNRHDKICSYLSDLDCWYNFTLTQTVEVVCLWTQDPNGLSFKFKINAMTRPVTTYTSTLTQTRVTPLKPKPKIYKVGPYAVMFVWNWRILRKIAALTSLSRAHGLILRNNSHTTWMNEKKKKKLYILSKRIYSLQKRSGE